jgi:hypothetical protein
VDADVVQAEDDEDEEEAEDSVCDGSASFFIS